MKPQAEPSMDEILASIRKIIAEDPQGSVALPPPPPDGDAGPGSLSARLNDVFGPASQPGAPKPMAVRDPFEDDLGGLIVPSAVKPVVPSVVQADRPSPTITAGAPVLPPLPVAPSVTRPVPIATMAAPPPSPATIGIPPGNGAHPAATPASSAPVVIAAMAPSASPDRAPNPSAVLSSPPVGPLAQDPGGATPGNRPLPVRPILPTALDVGRAASADTAKASPSAIELSLFPAPAAKPAGPVAPPPPSSDEPALASLRAVESKAAARPEIKPEPKPAPVVIASTSPVRVSGTVPPPVDEPVGTPGATTGPAGLPSLAAAPIAGAVLPDDQPGGLVQTGSVVATDASAAHGAVGAETGPLRSEGKMIEAAKIELLDAAADAAAIPATTKPVSETPSAPSSTSTAGPKVSAASGSAQPQSAPSSASVPTATLEPMPAQLPALVPSHFPSDASGSTLPAEFEEKAAELLRPMLRSWLDTNMPRIVEKALLRELAENPPEVVPKPDEGSPAI